MADQPAASFAQDLVKDYREATDKIRARADLSAKTLGGLATSALTAVGIAKFADVFPFPNGFWAWIWLVLVIVGFLSMAAVIAFFTYRLWRINRPIVMASDPKLIEELDEKEELALAEKVYQRAANLNGVPSLRAYEARAHRLERIAERAPEQPAKRLTERASQIRVGVQATQARAGLVIVRRRAARAIYGSWSIAAYVVFALSVLVFAIGTDYLASKRTDEVALAKSCGEAHTAGATTLPNMCDDYVASKRTDKVALAKSCGEARTAGATRLPGVCDNYVASKRTDGVALAKSCGEALGAGATRLPDVCDRFNVKEGSTGGG
jgi:hypothetical protein